MRYSFLMNTKQPSFTIVTIPLNVEISLLHMDWDITLLHKDKQSSFVDRADTMLDNTINEYERQANAFAAE